MDGGAARRVPPWWVARPNRSARERRNQRRRAAGRTVQELLRSLASIGEHRGCKRTVLGDALYTALQAKISSACGNDTKDVDGTAAADTVCRPFGGGGNGSSVVAAKACRSLDGDGVVPVVPLVDPMVAADAVRRPFGGGSKDSLVVAAKACRSRDGDGVVPVVPLVDPLAAADTVRRPLGDSSKDSSVVAAMTPLDGGGVEPVVPHVDPLVVADKFCRPFGGGGEDPSVVEAMDCRPIGGGGVDQVVEQDSSVGEKASRSLDGGGAEQVVPRVDPLVAADTACRPVVGKYAFGCGGADTWENTPDKGTNAELTAAVEKLSEAFLMAERLQRQLVTEGAAQWIGFCVKHLHGIIGEGIGIIKSLQK